ncbi:MAG: glycosyltransferase family 39 protein [Leptospiraceae bacterium]|nr:glycosyltransferase family 39 protein [Leptospiraceae bacterium]
MHISTVRESVLNNQTLMPYLNGAPNYFKPPLLFWMAIGMEKLLGQHLWVDRLPAVILGSLSVGVLFLLLQAAKTSIANSIIASFVYLFSISTFKFSRLLMMEQGLALAFLLVSYHFILYLRLRKYYWLLFAGIFAGIGSLFKGPFFLAYTGLLLLVWTNSILLRFKYKPFLWKGKSYLKEISASFTVFHIGASIPIFFWLSAYYIYQGKDILKYFFVIENIGKFYFENQSELGIFWGWFIYTTPWTILIIYFLYYSYKQPVYLFRHRIGKYLLFTTILITILHLLPNRKDAYYIVPSIPILLAGITLLLPNRLSQDFLSPLRTNILFNTILLILLLIPIMIFCGYKLTFFLTLFAILLSVTIIFYYKSYLTNIRIALLIALVYGISFVDFFQFVILPSLNYPIVPEQVKHQIQSDVCIVSEEPWDAYSFVTYLPKKEISHIFPGHGSGCLRKNQSRIFFRINPDFNLNSKKSLIKWKVWKRNLNFYEILKNPAQTELYFDTVYYQNTRSDLDEESHLKNQDN